MKYLIVEDDFGDVWLLSRMLQRLGYEVKLTPPEDAVRENQQMQPDVVQLDGLGGLCFDLYQRMQPDNPDAEYILYSSRMELHARGRELGMTAFDKGDPDILTHVKQLLDR